MNCQIFEMKRTDLEKMGHSCGEAGPYPPNFKPGARLTMVVAWQAPSRSAVSSTKHKPSFPTVCAVIFMVVLAVAALLGTYYACELLAERVQNMQLLQYRRPQASISDVRKYANPR